MRCNSIGLLGPSRKPVLENEADVWSTLLGLQANDSPEWLTSRAQHMLEQATNYNRNTLHAKEYMEYYELEQSICSYIACSYEIWRIIGMLHLTIIWPIGRGIPPSQWTIWGYR